ncbi:odorant receptor coreceptor-like [Topomyia yanbarensis]|uniref:odorant receptor coreceptor-like n=1 Tax=Topomyia yanbarensis TaxID=2498891 RepID=UPI00273C76A8|nr:odorant receptor coreceptor-like [Topomyia yanbarensis]
MNLIIKMMRAIGFWSQPDGRFSLWKANLFMFFCFLWPTIVIILRQQQSFRGLMLSLIECIILVKVLYQAIVIVYYRPQLEQIFYELKCVLEQCSVDTHYDVQATLRPLQTSSGWLFKGYIGIEVVSVSIYALMPTTFAIFEYATTGIFPPVTEDMEAEVASQMKTVLSSLLLLLYGTCMFVICMTMMVLTIAKGDNSLLSKMGALLCFIFFQIFSYSMLGTELMTSSSLMAQAVYATHWHHRSVSEQRSLLFMLGRSQRATTLTAAHFFSVNRATFATTLKSAFSAFAVLRQLYDSSQYQ